MSDQPAGFSWRKGFRRPGEYLSLRLRNRLNRHSDDWEDIRGSLRFLQGPPERENVQTLFKEWNIKERRNQLIDHLDTIYRKAYEWEKPFLDPTTYDRLKIRCETLDLKNEGEYDNATAVSNFFVPFSPETLKKHQIITPDDEARSNYESHEDIFEKTEEGFASQALAFRLMWHFDWFRRDGITDRRGRLIDITVWREAEISEFIQDFFLPGVYYQRSHSPAPAAWWTAKSTPLPHLMCMLQFRFEGTEDLLRGEILTILATMITRLELEDYQGEVVVPVLMFSVMSDFTARIIQAYFNGDKLMIRKSRLCDFSTRETLSSSTTLFMQWMASNPVGDTSGFALEDFVPFEEDDNTKSSIKKEAETENTSDAP